LSITEQGAGVFELDKFFEYVEQEYETSIVESEDQNLSLNEENHLKLNVHPYKIDLR